MHLTVHIKKNWKEFFLKKIEKNYPFEKGKQKSSRRFSMIHVYKAKYIKVKFVAVKQRATRVWACTHAYIYIYIYRQREREHNPKYWHQIKRRILYLYMNEMDSIGDKEENQLANKTEPANLLHYNLQFCPHGWIPFHDKPWLLSNQQISTPL